MSDALEQIRAAGCDAETPSVYLNGDDTYTCRCLVCSRCGHHTGNNTQGHYWGWCKVTGSVRDFCCPGNCELESSHG